MDIFTIDGGTTNTRIAWVCDGVVKKQIKLPCGAGRTAETGNNQALCRAVGEGIRAMSELCEVSEIVVSGMCNSELGLCEVAHIMAPADIKTLADHVKTVHLPEVSPHLFRLIPGIKCGMDSLETADMMRGEETEFFGLCKAEHICGAVLAVSPGTHTKLIQSDELGRIVSCITTMSGEMMAALSQNTILKQSLLLPFPKEYDSDALIKGYRFAKQYGLNQALFKVRILRTQLEAEGIEANSFFTGAILSADIGLIAKASEYNRILVGGSEPLNRMFAELIAYETKKEVLRVSKENAEITAALGAYEIYQKM